MRPTLAILTLAGCTLACGSAFAGTPSGFSIDWYSIDNGGGVSVSDDNSLKLSGSIGQHEPDVISLCSAEAGVECVDPVLQLTGGFWVARASRPGTPGPGCEGIDACIFADGFEPGDSGTPP